MIVNTVQIPDITSEMLASHPYACILTDGTNFHLGMTTQATLYTESGLVIPAGSFKHYSYTYSSSNTSAQIVWTDNGIITTSVYTFSGLQYAWTNHEIYTATTDSNGNYIASDEVSFGKAYMIPNGYPAIPANLLKQYPYAMIRANTLALSETPMYLTYTGALELDLGLFAGLGDDSNALVSYLMGIMLLLGGGGGAIYSGMTSDKTTPVIYETSTRIWAVSTDEEPSFAAGMSGGVVWANHDVKEAYFNYLAENEVDGVVLTDKLLVPKNMCMLPQNDWYKNVYPYHLMVNTGDICVFCASPNPFYACWEDVAYTETETLETVPVSNDHNGTGSGIDKRDYTYTEHNITTHGYPSYAGMVAKPGKIQGGVLRVEWDTAELGDGNLQMSLFLFDADGKPYKHTGYGDGSGAGYFGDDDVGFTGELYEPTYVDPAPADNNAIVNAGYSYGTLIAPFTTQIPEGCTVMVYVRCTSYPCGNFADRTALGQWLYGGGIKFTVEKASTKTQYSTVMTNLDFSGEYYPPFKPNIPFFFALGIEGVWAVKEEVYFGTFTVKSALSYYAFMLTMEMGSLFNTDEMRLWSNHDIKGAVADEETYKFTATNDVIFEGTGAIIPKTTKYAVSREWLIQNAYFQRMLTGVEDEITPFDSKNIGTAISDTRFGKSDMVVMSAQMEVPF